MYENHVDSPASAESTRELRATISVVIPVYSGEHTLAGVVDELRSHMGPRSTPAGRAFEITEIIVVHDSGPDQSAAVMRDIAARHPEVRCVWLSRNFGQHAATLAGIAASSGEWVVTMDEDGQHDPAAIGVFLDAAVDAGCHVVYADFTNRRRHGVVRDAASTTAKRMLGTIFQTPDSSKFQSFRLIDGWVARGVAARATSGVYIDVALTWVTTHATTAPTQLRVIDDRESSYSARRLLGYFWRMVLTSGTRPLRMVSVAGALSAVVGLGFALYIVISAMLGQTEQAGWASLMTVILVGVGMVLISLGVIAEYVGVMLSVSMGRPAYFTLPHAARTQPRVRR